MARNALQQARHANAKIPVQGKLRTSKGAFVRFFVPDTDAKVDHEALSAMLAVLAGSVSDGRSSGL